MQMFFAMAPRPKTLIYFDPRTRGGELVGESRLTKEWLTERYPDGEIIGRIRLGPTRRSAPGVELSPSVAKLLSVENWFPDALVLDADECLIVEAKINPKPAAIGEVLFYQRLIWRTPGLEPFQQFVFQPVVLFGEDDPDINDFARSLGVRVEIHAPQWLESHLLDRQLKNRASRLASANQTPEES